MRNWRVEALIVAAGLFLAGFMVYLASNNFINRSRVVTVKGLAEMQVTADRVIWPLMYKDVGNDPTALYNNIETKNNAIIKYLKTNGIQESEISIAAPAVVDMQADRYNTNPLPFRYNATSVVTVNSTQVDLVRKLMSQQAELLKQGIALGGEEYRYNTIFEYTALNEIKPKMIEEATKNARAAAEKFAKDSGSKLGKIQNATQGQFTIENRDVNTPYIKNIRVVTTINYYLKR